MQPRERTRVTNPYLSTCIQRSLLPTRSAKSLRYDIRIDEGSCKRRLRGAWTSVLGRLTTNWVRARKHVASTKSDEGVIWMRLERLDHGSRLDCEEVDEPKEMREAGGHRVC